jgi:pullulanase
MHGMNASQRWLGIALALSLGTAACSPQPAGTQEGGAARIGKVAAAADAAGITVYTQGYTHIYWWNSTPANSPANTNWPGSAMGTDAASGWKTYSFPAATAINLIFSNNGSGQTPDMTRTTGSWWYRNGVWTATNPLGPTATATPGTSTFTTTSLTVTLHATNPGNGTYTIDGGAAVAFNDGATVPLGASLSVGGSTTLKVMNGTAANTYTYTKAAAPPAGITVYTQNYTHIYWWNSTPANSPANTNWPGAVMGTDAASGLKTYSFPAATAINLIFSNNGSGQTADLTRTTGSWSYLNGVWAAYTPQTQVATPTFSPAAGTYNTAQSVTLASTTAGASIRYTTDGSTPTSTTGTLYTAPVTVSSNLVIRAIAFASGMTDSTVSSASYTISTTVQAAAPTFNPPAGTYSTTQNVTLASTTAGVSIRYTLDGSTPTTTTGTLYTAPVTVSSSLTLRAIAFASGLTTSAVSQAAYTITPVAQAAAPTFTPPAGTYTGAQSVTLASTTAGASIRYTTDGSTPTSTTGTLYAAPVTVSSSLTLRAIAFASGTTSSTVSAAAYTINAAQAIPNTLGALYTPSATTFRIWSPDNGNVSVNVAGSTRTCTPNNNLTGYTSVYECVVSGDLKDQTYQFNIGGAPVRDPYAMMVNPGTTQGVVVDMANILPTDGSWAARPALTNREDAIIYEVHVRDFTIDANSGVDAAKRGKFMGMVQTGTTFTSGGTTVKTGIDHLKELGVTHVQIMPSYDFGTAMYNWGYDPVNYNVPEEQYAQATTPEGRIREFKDMVNEFHKNGIRVIMDVVYNHTFNKDVLSAITSKYYTALDLSGTGNSIDDGNAMVSRMIRDSLEHWVKDYNIDGFRFDLLGVFYYTDVRDWGIYFNGDGSPYADRNLLMYGEPWIGGSLSDADRNKEDAAKVRFGNMLFMQSGHVGVFNGRFRDALRGDTDTTVKNYIFNRFEDGSTFWWGAIAAGSRGSIMANQQSTTPLSTWDSMFAYDPEQSIYYVSVHDNLNLYDKILHAGATLATPTNPFTTGPTGYAGQIDRFAVGIIMTSQGIPLIQEGDEFLRSKALNGDFVKAANSYNNDAGDSVNMVRWADLVNNASVNKYYKDAIALRKATSAMRLTTWSAISNQVKTTLNVTALSNRDGQQYDGNSIHVANDTSLPIMVVASYLASNPATPAAYDTLVVYNSGGDMNMTLPAGTWTKVFDTTGARSPAPTDTVCQGTAVTVFKKN